MKFDPPRLSTVEILGFVMDARNGCVLLQGGSVFQCRCRSSS